LKSDSPKDNTVCAIFSTAMAISTGWPGECGCWRGDNPVKSRTGGGFGQLEVKKDGARIV
jgi:hypothetical protein